jgi:hypothetical protein
MVSMSDAVSVAAARPEPAAVPDLVGQAQAELAQAEAAGRVLAEERGVRGVGRTEGTEDGRLPPLCRPCAKFAVTASAARLTRTCVPARICDR